MVDIIEIEHPLARHDLTILRDRATQPAAFRSALNRLTRLLLLDAMKNLPTAVVAVETPLEKTEGERLAGTVWLCPVLRAGTGMLASALELLPEARVATIGLYRDETTLQPRQYYLNLPPGDGTPVVAYVLDPMLATGGTAVATIRLLAEKVEQINLITVLCAPQGVTTLKTLPMDIRVFTASVDRQLNDKGYILPGLGDAGDRVFNTVVS